MFKWAKIVLAISIVFGLAALCFGLTWHVRSYDYTGKISFQTESDYSQFKSYVSNQKISFSGEGQSLVVLSSDPPIVVDFKKLRVPSDITFPYLYQDKTSNYSNIGFVVAFAVIAGIGIIVVMICGVKKWNKEQ